MKILYSIIILLAAVFLISCSLERSNPVDPENNSDVIVPGEIADLDLTPSTSSSTVKYMDLTWSRVSSIDGYYIYKATTYDGEYIRADNGGENGVPPADSLYFRDTEVQEDETYYYSVSAYTRVDEFILEGKRSIPRGAKVK